MNTMKPALPSKNDNGINALIACLVIALLLFMVYGQMAFFSAENLDDSKKPILDFIPFWSAGKMAFTGDYAHVYNREAVYEIEKTIIETLTSQNYLPWLNPPTFLLVMNVLGGFDFTLSFWIWSIVSISLFLSITWCIFPNRYAFLMAALFPPFIFSLILGQTGALTASISIMAFLNIEKRPVLAGILIGLLAIKPQTAVLIPVALLASKNWKVMFVATMTVCAFILATVFLYGANQWHEFFINTLEHNKIVLSKVDYNDYYLQSLYGLFVYFKLNLTTGLIAQGVVTVLSICIVFFGWRHKSIPLSGRIAVLVACTLMFQSYSLIYDYTIVYFVIILLLGIPPYNKQSRKRAIAVIAGSMIFLVPMYLKEPSGFFLCLFILGVVFYDLRQHNEKNNILE